MVTTAGPPAGGEPLHRAVDAASAAVTEALAAVTWQTQDATVLAAVARVAVLRARPRRPDRFTVGPMTDDPYLTTTADAPTAEPPAGTHALLTRAVQLGVESVARGGGPFGAVVARPQGGVLVPVAEGANQVTATNDPTAHAEVVALRAAGAALGTFDLSGCVLLASCEPCPMCLTAGLWARVDSMWFAASREDAAAAGFDDLAFYDAMAQPREQWSVPVRAVELSGRTAPFDAWSRTAGRVEY